jgi:hypothetical protein
VRQQNGLRPLQDNERLAQLARNYSWQMAEKNFFSHTGADGSTPNQRVRVGRVSFWVVAENLLKSPTNISQPGNVAVESWLKTSRISGEYSASRFHTNGCRSLANWQYLLHYAVVFTTLVGAIA